MAATTIPKLRERLLALPKTELHCHLLGTVQRQTFEALVRAADSPLSAADVESFYTRGDKPVGVLRVLRALEDWLLRGPDDFHRITYEYLCAAAQHGVRHAEFFWNPTGSERARGLRYGDLLPAIQRAMADAQTDTGISARLIPAIDREAPASHAQHMVKDVIAHRVDEVPGIGIDYRENDHPPEHFAEAYALARHAGLRTTAHAGEFGMPWTNVRTAIDVLKVDRIDHGYTIIDHAPLVAQAREAGLVFTVVPTNSYYLRTLPKERWAQDHPIRAMLAAGLKLHPNTDDPTLHQVTPIEAWAMMVEQFGATWADVESFVEHGIDAAWVDDSTRLQWRNRWRPLVATLRPDADAP